MWDKRSALLPDQQPKSREGELARRVIYHIHLAGVKAGFELCERHIQLENGSSSIARVQFFYFLQRTLVCFRLPLEKGDVGQ